MARALALGLHTYLCILLCRGVLWAVGVLPAGGLGSHQGTCTRAQGAGCACSATRVGPTAPGTYQVKVCEVQHGRCW